MKATDTGPGQPLSDRGIPRRTGVLVPPGAGLILQFDRIVRPGGLAPWQERRAKELLSSNFERALTVAEVAHACRLSRGHFTRAFRISTGLAPLQWLNALRIDIAKTLLRNSRITILHIVMECGFADQSHFSRVFRGLTGCSPGKWRRQMCSHPASRAESIHFQPERA